MAKYTSIFDAADIDRRLGDVDKKAGHFYYDATNNRYLVFTNEEARDEYLEDPTKVELIIGSFDAPFNYTAEINLLSKPYNAVFYGSVGNNISFDFDIKNKQGASTGENVLITYTITRGSVKHVVKETRRFGDSVVFNVDKYISEGTNLITVSIVGQSSLAATTSVITYQVINLSLTDTYDISKAYDISGGTIEMEIPYTVSGVGAKVIEWYIDGVKQDYNQSEDYITEPNLNRIKKLTLSGLSHGRHSIQFRAYTEVNNEKFYSDTLYRDFFVYTENRGDLMIGISITIPAEYGVTAKGDRAVLYNMVQYIPYTLTLASYSPSKISESPISVYLDDELKGSIVSSNGRVYSLTFSTSTSGDKTLRIVSDTVTYEIPTKVQKTSLSLEEITNALAFDFNAQGRSNTSADRDSWSYGDYTGTLEGFKWNTSSGWVDGRLEMSEGDTFIVNYAPLSDHNSGKTIELEWMTKKVTNDDAIICDLRNAAGAGLLITATSVILTSKNGVEILTRYKSDENVRVGVVVLPATSATDKMAYIYTNGILSRAINLAAVDNYNSDTYLSFRGTSEASLSLKSVRVYDAALNSNQMLNNHMLYRDTIEEMLEIYERNDIYDGIYLDTTKMSSRLPVMIVTGDVDVLEATSNKDTQIQVDIEYINMQDTSRSFTLTKAAMRPQGTSSMDYPKKNFRIYTRKYEETILRDANGNVVEDGLYSFKDKAIPVDCWCLKADYAESSGTHNTGIARLWNKALYDAKVTINLGEGNEHNVDEANVLRTQAQQKALDNGYEYDVRTAIDGFPILMFYHKNANDPLIFIGKYNFNNDKSTENVFGFTDIPGFDNSRMQCWEVLNNDNPIGLFTDISDFYNDVTTIEGTKKGWEHAFESRYPDTKSPNTVDLYNFAVWMNGINGDHTRFAEEKWQHLDVYKVAAYYCYLMRHAGADQFVKNSMFTSEDGEHFYFILYDNDTINGLNNDGFIEILPTDNRQSKYATGSHKFAGHDSVLWNMLEADQEFIAIVSNVDSALAQAGISYNNVIKMFDEEQADKWVERVYNLDAEYKYINPFTSDSVNQLGKLQGKRDLHRRWWLANRFALYDSILVSGDYKSNTIEIKPIDSTPAGQQFTITSGYPIHYGYGINNLLRERTDAVLEVDDSKTFIIQTALSLGDPIDIYGAPYVKSLDLSLMMDRLQSLDISGAYLESLGTRLETLIVGSREKENITMTTISGLANATNLSVLNVENMKAMKSLNLSNQKYLTTLKAIGSGIASAALPAGAPISRLELPSVFSDINLSSLPYLTQENFIHENIGNVYSIQITDCPDLTDDFEWVYDWYTRKTTEDKDCTLILDNVDWALDDADAFMEVISIIPSNGTLSLKGKVEIKSIKVEQVYAIRDILGESSFNPNAEFYVDVPSILQIDSEDSVLEGENLQFTSSIYPYLNGVYTWSLEHERKGCYINQDGLLVTEETAQDTSDVIVRLDFVSTDGETLTATKSVSVVRRTYPQDISIVGTSDPRDLSEYAWTSDTEGVNGRYSVVWSLEGSVTTCWGIDSSDEMGCSLLKKSAMPNSLSGNIKVSIVRDFDGYAVSVGVLALSIPVVFPSNATIQGSTNPLEKPNTYTWSTTTEGVNGELYAVWTLTGDATSVIEIASQNDEECVIGLLEAPTEIVSGLLKLTLYKVADDSVILTATKELEAVMEDVVITRKSNPSLQDALYDNNLVANKDYSLKEEVEAITSKQLDTAIGFMTGTERNVFVGFDEFRYFTGVTEIYREQFFNFDYLESIILPDSITTIGSSAFLMCVKLKRINIPRNVSQMGSAVFAHCSSLEGIYIEDIESWLQISFEDSPFYENLAKLFLNDTLFEHLDIPESISSVGHCFAGYKHLKSITFPSNYASLEKDAFDGCVNVKTIKSLNENAPSAVYNPFGQNQYCIGYNTRHTGENYLYLPLKAVGYENGAWLNPLQNPDICGFSIYGRLNIIANSKASYNVTYITIESVQKTIRVGNGPVYIEDVMYDTEMTITVVSGGIPDEGVTKTFIYSKGTQEHTFTFPAEGTWITIDQTVTDPATMITGDVNGEHVQAIYNGTHRYLGKYTATGKMTLCQLSDSNSEVYNDGATANLEGGDGDVFVMLPRFWYSCIERMEGVWDIGFFVGEQAPSGDGWNEWDGNDLLGVYVGHINNQKIYSYSGKGIQPAYRTSLTTAISYASKRGTGFSIFPMKWFNILNLLYYAKYGTTNFLSTYPSSLKDVFTTGGSNSTGKSDSQNENNFWGIEGLVRSYSGNFIGNVIVDFVSTTEPKTHKWKISENDGSVREVTGTMESGYVKKMVFGENADIIPSQGGGTSTQGFCVDFTRAASSNRAVYVSLGYSIKANAANNNSISHGRLSFRGNIVIQNDSTIFKSLTAIG